MSETRYHAYVFGRMLNGVGLCEECDEVKANGMHTAEGWQPIETAPRGTHLLYFPPDEDARLAAWFTVDRVPSLHIRKPTHWMRLPEPPK